MTTAVLDNREALTAKTQTGEFTGEQLETIKRLWEAGHSQREICALVGVKYEAFRYRLIHSGYELVTEERRTMQVKRPAHIIEGCA